jgi:methionyl-tRNA formyltransferase
MGSKKKILIISDNPIMCSRFEREVWILIKSNIFEISYKCSPFSKIDNFDLKKKVEIIDLRVQEQVEKLYDFEIIFSIHCKQLFPAILIEKVRCINLHPGYNPINRGWYPQVFSIINNLEIGATIHEMDDKLDNGPIIAREFVEKYIWDTSLSLYNRVLDKEIELLGKNIESILKESYNKISPESEGNLYKKNDFNNLCKIDFNEVATFKFFYNKLRALTHGDYKNAYFIDESNGKKIFVSIEIEKEL